MKLIKNIISFIFTLILLPIAIPFIAHFLLYPHRYKEDKITIDLVYWTWIKEYNSSDLIRIK